MSQKSRSYGLLVGGSLAAMLLLGWAIAQIPTGIGRGSFSSPFGIEQDPVAGDQTQLSEAPGGISVAEPFRPTAPVEREERVYSAPASADQDPLAHAQQRTVAEARLRFDQAVSMLRTGQYEYAVPALQRVLELAPGYADAYVNLGYAYLGLERVADALQAFQTAMHQRPEQANAYYGMAIAYERQGDLEGAMGAMKMFLDFADGTAQDNPYIRRGRSALWEWEAKLGDGPWGPTKGIPPGWTEEMVRRDGTGVGVYGMKRGESLEQAQERRRQEAAEATAAPQASAVTRTEP